MNDTIQGMAEITPLLEQTFKEMYECFKSEENTKQKNQHDQHKDRINYKKGNSKKIKNEAIELLKYLKRVKVQKILDKLKFPQIKLEGNYLPGYEEQLLHRERQKLLPAYQEKVKDFFQYRPYYKNLISIDTHFRMRDIKTVEVYYLLIKLIDNLEKKIDNIETEKQKNIV